MKRTACLLALLLVLGCCACSAAETAQTNGEPAGQNEVPSPAGDVSQPETEPGSGEAAAGDAAETETGEPGALARVMEIVLAKAEGTDPYGIWNRAALVDLNGDGTEELLFTYQTMDEMEQRLEIWTEEDGEPRILYDRNLFIPAGGPRGGVKWMEMNGVTYLCIYESNYGGRGLQGNSNFTGSIQCFSPGNWDELGLCEQYRMSYDFYGPDNRTPDPDPQEPESLLWNRGAEMTVEQFQAVMAAFDQSQDILLHVGDEPPVGASLEETARALGLEIPAD
jgi:hypothetical protein